ncbi:hypothetical protein Sru01_45140 [Sphaerisporangium rufum]|uniref:Uncharacterized protein n=1 Tax=Sphaerisporangium rufum TaxID=1381558 RepID=A0A919R4G8_9ACTN|nr:hypothetical protein [Sphaerisporangium rufum]GII79532.1 hypothetical protein Sru01_45140 [Sphaerisporangium rufum]
MTHEEKRSWIHLVVTVLAYTGYVIVVTGRAEGRPLPEVPYAAALLWTIGGAIVASMAAEIGMAVIQPRASRAVDVRDREIGRYGEHVGQSFVVIGAVAAMLMAVAGWDRFWIANVVYLCFVLASILGSVTKVVLYRRSVPQW